MVRITYHGHACFTLEAEGYRVVLDPYKDGMVDGLPNLRLTANAVYGSHGHADHNWFEAVAIENAMNEPPYQLEELETPHDDRGGVLRGMNTLRIFTFGDLRIAHLGDLGDFPEEAVLEKLKGVDCVLIPVGGTYTIDPDMAHRIIDAVNPRVCVPMHYRTDSCGFDVLYHIDEFTKHYAQVLECEDSFLLTKDTPKQMLLIHNKV